MRIKWRNITLLVLTILLVIVLVRFAPTLRSLSQNVKAVGATGEDQVTGMMALGMVCMTALGIAIVLSRRR